MGKSIKTPYIGDSKEEPKDPRFSEQEIELLKKLDEQTLKTFRSVFYQDILTNEQFENLRSILSQELIDVLKKVFTPSLDWKEPLFSMPNRWTNPRYEGVLCAEVKLAVMGRQKAIRFMEKGVVRLWEIMKGSSHPLPLEVDIRMEKDYKNLTAEEAKIETVAMQDAIQYLESGIMALFLYVMSPEDKEEIVKKLRRNSAE